MKKLNSIVQSPKGFAKHTFNQVLESDLGYIYEQFNDFLQEVTGYHVFEKRINNLFDCESYPGPESFGIWAFQFRNLQEAVKCFNKLTSKETRKQTNQTNQTNTQNG